MSVLWFTPCLGPLWLQDVGCRFMSIGEHIITISAGLFASQIHLNVEKLQKLEKTTIS